MYPYNCSKKKQTTTWKNHTSWEFSDSIWQNHLGIVLNKNQNSGTELLLPVIKDRNPFTAFRTLALLMSTPSLCLTYIKEFRSSVLNGWELWNVITQEEIQRLNTLQHGICKVILEPPIKNKQEAICANNPKSLTPIMAENDAWKLLFFGRLWRIDPRYLTKQIFKLRLISFFKSNLTQTQ